MERQTIADQPKSIADLTNLAIQDTSNAHIEFHLGNVPNYQAQAIAAATGINVRGAKKIVNAHGIRHVQKGHFDCNLEAARGQVAIQLSDFSLIEQILLNPDSYAKGSQNNRKKQQAVVFVKKLPKGTYNVVMSLVTSNHAISLTFNTMYIKK